MKRSTSTALTLLRARLPESGAPAVQVGRGDRADRVDVDAGVVGVAVADRDKDRAAAVVAADHSKQGKRLRRVRSLSSFAGSSTGPLQQLS